MSKKILYIVLYAIRLKKNLKVSDNIYVLLLKKFNMVVCNFEWQKYVICVHWVRERGSETFHLIHTVLCLKFVTQKKDCVFLIGEEAMNSSLFTPQPEFIQWGAQWGARWTGTGARVSFEH